MSNELFMIRCDLNRAALVRLAQRRKIPTRDLDTGYAAHMALRTLFGDLAPQPFVSAERGRYESILGYTSHAANELLRHAQTFANPSDFGALETSSLASKLLPSDWPSGHRLGFEIRVCPVIRKSSAGPKHRAGAEVDAFLARCWENGDAIPVDREAVYGEWLRQRLEQHGAARVLGVSMLRFRRGRLARSDHASERRMIGCERPDATLRGVLEVSDSVAFKTLLARGDPHVGCGRSQGRAVP